jgi:translation initiation factor IF-3
MGFELIKKVTEDLLEYGTAEVDPKLLGRNISVTFAPTKGHGHK